MKNKGSRDIWRETSKWKIRDQSKQTNKQKTEKETENNVGKSMKLKKNKTKNYL